MWFSPLPLEPVISTGQKYSLPTDEDSASQKLVEKKPPGGQPWELSSETAGNEENSGLFEALHGVWEGGAGRYHPGAWW